ncbi:SDR family oxidoreductase, partial [Staphylococcus shinii]|uniref:SDR family oxidoreductase n=2 Tax=Staphylococcus TaxID=1279 RepID=UPI000E6815AC
MDNKHYIITGGTSGLGYSIVKALLNKGCKVTILSRDLYKFNQIELFKNNKNVQAIECDLLNIEDLKILERKLSHDIDGFIHCAGLSYIVNMSSISIEQMDEIYKINTINFSILLNVLRKFFVEEPTIVGISSFASVITDKGTGHYGASKAAFSQILNTLRMEEPKYHVLVVNPGPI